MKILGIIPARYASTRFPAKAMHLIEGKTMVQRVLERSLKASALTNVVVATDHEIIFNHIKNLQQTPIMTQERHPSGTDRCQEALQQAEKLFGVKYDFVLNIQGDEPFIRPAQINALCEALSSDTELATLIKKISSEDELSDPNEVKITMNTAQEALYFSRNIIPYLHKHKRETWLQNYDFYKHVGMYAYRTDILEKITKLSVSSLEEMESLEQLRWLENGFKIKLVKTDIDSFCVDVIEDLNRMDLKAFLEEE